MTDEQPTAGLTASWCNYLAVDFCNKCGRVHDGSPSRAFASMPFDGRICPIKGDA